jgi:hypothetical protein
MLNLGRSACTPLLLAAVSCGDASPPPASESAVLYANVEPSGKRLPTAALRWTYTEVPGAFCRDGSQTGVAIHANPRSDKLLIYLEQGGACFDSQSCLLNPANAALDLLAVNLGVLGTDGLFDRSQRDNPVRDWNFVYVPYCTGDLHLGVRPEGEVAGVGPQKFVGYTNLQFLLPRIAATFPHPSAVFLAGASAGGTGSLAHAARVREQFPDAALSVLDDAGPQLSSTVLHECVQRKISELWGLADTWLADCGADCPNPSDSFQDYAAHVARALPDVPVGVLQAAGDAELRSFAARAASGCSGAEPTFSASQLTADFIHLRQKLQPFENAGTFLVDSEQHTWTATRGFYDARAGETRLVDWVRTLLEGQGPGHVGP